MSQLFDGGNLGKNLLLDPTWDTSFLSEYLLIFSLPEYLRQEIMNEKKKFTSNYDYPLAYATKPHITLVNFLQFRLLEQRLILQLHKITANQSSLEVGLKNFGSFSSGDKNAIYIDIAHKDPIKKVVNRLKQAQNFMMPDSKYKPHFITTPHLTIARGLENWRYEKAWPEYQYASFTGNFTCNYIYMLRRPLNERKYILAEKFELSGSASNDPQQGVLF